MIDYENRIGRKYALENRRLEWTVFKILSTRSSIILQSQANCMMGKYLKWKSFHFMDSQMKNETVIKPNKKWIIWKWFVWIIWFARYSTCHPKTGMQIWLRIHDWHFPLIKLCNDQNPFANPPQGDYCTPR